MSTIASTLSERLPDLDLPFVDGTVGDLLREQVARRPDAVALVATTHAGEHRRWTYAELLAAARHAAGSLLSVADPDDHVALWAPNVAEWPILQYAAALAGVTLVALDPAASPAALASCLRLSGASVLIHADRAGSRDMAAVVDEVAPQVPDLLDVISLSDVGRLYGSPVQPEELSAPEAPALMLFSPDTAGRLRAVLLSHRSLVNTARLTLLTAEVGPGAVAVAAVPAFQAPGCVVAHLGPASVGGTVVLVEEPDPSAVLAAIAADSASTLVCEPALLDGVLDAARSSGAAAAHLDTVLVGPSVAAATPDGSTVGAARETLGAFATHLYGRPELPVMCLTRRADDRDDLATTVGRPLPHTGARIVDPAGGAVVPLGDTGEICARGPLQMIGYLDDPASTAAAVDAEGWLHTGDLGSMDERGVVRPTGRVVARGLPPS